MSYKCAKWYFTRAFKLFMGNLPQSSLSTLCAIRTAGTSLGCMHPFPSHRQSCPAGNIQNNNETALTTSAVGVTNSMIHMLNTKYYTDILTFHTQ